MAGTAGRYNTLYSHCVCLFATVTHNSPFSAIVVPEAIASTHYNPWRDGQAKLAWEDGLNTRKDQPQN